MPRSSHLVLSAVVLLTAFPPTARAWTRERATTFATLPQGAAGPEGIEVDDAGNVYVSTFGFGGGQGQIYVFDRDGNLLRQVSVAGSTESLLGLAFHPATRKLLVIDFGAAKVLDVDPVSGASKDFLTLADPSGAGLNDITFDDAGNVYVSDSFNGVVWRTTAAGGVATKWVESALLKTSGVPPLRANGLRFDSGGRAGTGALFVANTGNDTVVKIPVSGGSPGTPVPFVSSINGADGLLVDQDDNLWVAANQADEIVVVDPTGKGIAKLGDFDGVRDGSPVGLLFPASLRFSGNSLLVTNLSLDLRAVNPDFAAVDSQWAALVTRHTVARLPARIPRVPGLAR